jgi:hypothetical protein
MGVDQARLVTGEATSVVMKMYVVLYVTWSAVVAGCVASQPVGGVRVLVLKSYTAPVGASGAELAFFHIFAV